MAALRFLIAFLLCSLMTWGSCWLAPVQAAVPECCKQTREQQADCHHGASFSDDLCCISQAEPDDRVLAFSGSPFPNLLTEWVGALPAAFGLEDSNDLLLQAKTVSIRQLAYRPDQQDRHLELQVILD